MENEAQIFALLKSHKIRTTDCRIKVLDTFLGLDYALTHPDLEKVIGDGFDRVTIYRTLNTFLKKGLVHKVLDDEGTPKYALCSTQCGNSHVHSHDHVHFKCQSCGHTQCIENVTIPPIALPNGFEAKETNLLVQGVCASCNTK